MDDDVIASRTANALFAQAAVQYQFAMPGRFTAPARGVIEAFRRHYGGLWVGGTATLTRRHLSFAPNALNVAIHRDGERLHTELDLRTVVGVEVQGGFVTKIVQVFVPGGVLKLRCWRAKGFADDILKAVRAARGS